ncbi:GGDEF domain-containing protein [Uliginosibacterium aquaticum]|uniref:diguanylate cyclase n=1 Tax=Uliginosibacterium aquaticum TaxID=2731212 RepID=A0ABX2IF75_9RHOO|nr:GGDEF domain-containing protein [Uliginosibacterium aquaticum]NSL54448.1 GGDEF domain-containing protein [Uliginosibacterium aquaticum]
MLSLDSPTLLMTQAIVQWLLAALLMCERHSHASARFWSLALIMHGTGNLLLFLRPLMPHLAAILLYNGCAACAFSVSHLAFGRLVDQAVPRWVMLAPVLLICVLMLIFIDDIAMRVVVTSVVYGSQVVLISLMLKRGTWPPGSLLQRWLVISSALFALCFFVRALLCWLDPAPFTQLLGKSPIQAILILGGLAYGIMCTLVILLAKLEWLNQDLLRKAMLDSLTGVLNRGAFTDMGTQALKHGKFPISVLMIDVDHFKQINDRHGHAIGDQALRLCAEALQATLRTGDILGRIGGEEFCLVLINTDKAQAQTIAERLRAAVEAIPFVDNMETTLTISIGLITASKPEKLESLMQHADAALYVAKETGRNRVVCAHENPGGETLSPVLVAMQP